MINENITATGFFSLAIYENEKLKNTYWGANLVVDLGKANVAKLIGGGAGLAVSKFGAGTNGVEPNVTDTTLTNAFIKAIDSVSYPDANSVQFAFSIDSTEGNGLTLREFGLMTDTNTLFARKVRSDIVKTNAIRIVGTWKITIN